MNIKLSNQNIWLNFNHLYYFYVIAQEGSLTKASKKLNVGIPALSAQVKQLEMSLGMDLFHRQNKKLSLNVAGEKVLKFADEIYSIGQMLGDALGKSNTVIENFNIGVQEGVCRYQLVEPFKNLTMSGKKVSVQEMKLPELVSDISSGKLDFGFTNHIPAFAESKGVIGKRFAQSPIAIIGHKKFESLTRNFPFSLDDANFILPTESSKLRISMEHYFLANRIKINLVAESSDIELTRILAQEGLGLPCLPVPPSHREWPEGLIEIGRPERVKKEMFILYTNSSSDKLDELL